MTHPTWEGGVNYPGRQIQQKISNHNVIEFVTQLEIMPGITQHMTSNGTYYATKDNPNEIHENSL